MDTQRDAGSVSGSGCVFHAKSYNLMFKQGVLTFLSSLEK